MGDLSDTEGKLACPKCSCKVGQWNWSGAQCSCGSWVTPAIQVPLSRVDKIFPQDMPQSLPENGTMD
jgi:dual specificity phosphatase 12